MPDAFGDRAVFSVVLPVTNAMVEPDMADLRPHDVTNQTFRFPFPGLPDTVEALMELMGATLDTVNSCGPEELRRCLDAVGHVLGRVGDNDPSEAEVRDAFACVDSPDVDALVQVGTALVCAGLVDALEARHDKPVVAVNTATYWLTLREHGINDRLDGRGVLLARH